MAAKVFLMWTDLSPEYASAQITAVDEQGGVVANPSQFSPFTVSVPLGVDSTAPVLRGAVEAEVVAAYSFGVAPELIWIAR
jgi:hypothetical protein